MENIEWSNVIEAAVKIERNWWQCDSFYWGDGRNLNDDDAWLVHFTTNNDSGLLEQSNEAAFHRRLAPFAVNEDPDDDPDVVFEVFDHKFLGELKGFLVRVRRANGIVTAAFHEYCRIREELEECPVLDEADYTDREFQATLKNYRDEMGSLGHNLPEGWDQQVYFWFCDPIDYEYIESRHDRGGWAPQGKIIEALEYLGLVPPSSDEPFIVG